MSSIQIEYGLQLPEKIPVHISEAASGKHENIICNGCGSILVARKGEKNVDHFAHYNIQATRKCSESELHLVSKHIIASFDEMSLLSKLSYQKETLTITNRHLEKEILGFRVDVQLITKEYKKPINVEVVVTNRCQKSKVDSFRANKEFLVELDVSEYSVQNIEELKSDLKEGNVPTTWPCHFENQSKLTTVGLPNRFIEKNQKVRDEYERFEQELEAEESLYAEKQKALENAEKKRQVDNFNSHIQEIIYSKEIYLPTVTSHEKSNKIYRFVDIKKAFENDISVVLEAIGEVRNMYIEIFKNPGYIVSKPFDLTWSRKEFNFRKGVSILEGAIYDSGFKCFWRYNVKEEAERTKPVDESNWPF